MVIKPYIPLEFARKSRAIQDIDRWKATELRQFLLYTGIVVIKSILSPICYNHFLCLSVAVKILINLTMRIHYYCILFRIMGIMGIFMVTSIFRIMSIISFILPKTLTISVL